MSRAIALLAMVALISLFSSCKKENPLAADPIAHAEAYDIWPDSIDLHNDVILRVMNDSLMEIRVNGNALDSIFCDSIPAGKMTFTSDYPLLDFLYRLEASMSAQSKFNPSTPYEIFLNPLLTDSAEQILQSRLSGNLVIPYQSQRLEWPAVNINAEWLLAATELGAANGSRTWNRKVEQVAKEAMNFDNRICRNQTNGLYSGIPRYIATANGIFPQWMSQDDIAQITTFSVNIEYCAAMSRLGIPCDSLRRNIDNELWIPNMGYFSAMSYGFPTCQTPLQVTDNLAQAVGIISGQLSPAMAETVIRKTPVYHSGATLFQPQLPPASAEVNQEIPATLMQTAWTVAASKVDNRAAYSAAMGALFVSEGNRLLSHRNELPAFRATFSSFILRGLVGIDFHPDGIIFTPNVPDNLPGDKYISNLKYRDAILDIKLSGTGRAIATFTIDGKPADPFFDGSLKGRHEISITLAGPSSDPGSLTEMDEQMVAPLPPVANWDQRKAVIAEGQLPEKLKENELNALARKMLKDENPNCRLVYINGILQEEIYRDDYELFDAQTPTVVQFTAFYNSQLSGFSTEPYLYLPTGQRSLIYASTFAKSGTKVLENKKLAAKFVESNRFKNRAFDFEFDAPTPGRYLLEVRYINGLGIVNSQRKLTLRQLLVNSRDAGILIFPQLHSSVATDGESWEEHTDWSNPLVINLEKGINHLSMRFYQPSPVYVDPTSSTLLFDLIRITPTP